MIATILSLVTSAGFGTITGVFGAWLTRIEERKQKKIDYDYNLRMAEINLEESKLDRQHEIDMADKKRAEAETEGEIQADLIEAQSKADSEKLDGQSFIESIKAASKPVGIKWIDGLQKIMRVVITVYLLVIVTWFAYEVSSKIGGIDALNKEKMVDLYIQIISGLLFLTTVAVGWYFGKRATNGK